MVSRISRAQGHAVVVLASRFSPCFFLYICTMIPPIWFLEIDRISVKLGRVPVNRTEGDELKAMLEQGLISQTSLNDKTVRCHSALRERSIVDRPRLDFRLGTGEPHGIA